MTPMTLRANNPSFLASQQIRVYPRVSFQTSQSVPPPLAPEDLRYGQTRARRSASATVATARHPEPEANTSSEIGPALSGKKRVVMYRSESCAAATSEASWKRATLCQKVLQENKQNRCVVFLVATPKKSIYGVFIRLVFSDNHGGSPFGAPCKPQNRGTKRQNQNQQKTLLCKSIPKIKYVLKTMGSKVQDPRRGRRVTPLRHI